MKNWALLIFLLLLTGCSPLENPPTENTKPSEVDDLDYQLVYHDEEIEIREAFLVDVHNWSWSDFVMPSRRISDTDMDIISGSKLAKDCFEQLRTEEWCKQTLELKSANGESVQYILELESPTTGNIRLIKNDKIIWSGHINGGTGPGINSLIRIGNEIAFDYLNSNYDGENPDFWTKESIIMTNWDVAVDIVDTTGYDAAFAPNDIQGKLVYFAKKDGQEFLVFDGKEIGNKYDRVFRQYCCWDGPPVQIVGNGQIIDFFAVKNDAWYHIQAGKFDFIE